MIPQAAEALQFRYVGGVGAQIRFWNVIGTNRTNLAGTILEFTEPLLVQGLNPAGKLSAVTYQVPTSNVIKFIGDMVSNG